MAMGMMVVLPIMLLAFYMQKYIVRGMSYGAIRE
jgi:ABC-type glycerol-3-phosphate transport system permease component